MAKRKSGGPNKSAAIREYVTANPGAMPKEIVDAMKAQGVDVSTAFVSTIKSKTVGSGSKKKKKKGRKAVQPKSAANSAAASRGRQSKAGGNLSLDQLLKAKKLAAELGGVVKARATLEALEKIVG